MLKTEPRMKWHGDRETGPMENVGVGHYEKIKKWPPFCKYTSYGKISNYQPTLKVWVSGFPSIDRNRISASAIMKNLKNGHHFLNMHHTC